MCDTNRPGETCKIDARGRKVCGPTQHQRAAMMESARLMRSKMRGDPGAAARLTAHRAKLGAPAGVRPEELVLEIEGDEDAALEAANVKAMLDKGRTSPEGVGSNSPGGMRGVRLSRRGVVLRVTKIAGLSPQEYGRRSKARAAEARAERRADDAVRRAHESARAEAKSEADRADRDKREAVKQSLTRSVMAVPSPMPASFSVTSPETRQQAKSDGETFRVPTYVVGG